jgi:hypothetical protein
MSSFDILLRTPSIPMVLRSLIEAPEGRDESAFSSGSFEGPYVTTALEALLEHGLIEKDEGTLRLTDEPENSKKVAQLLEFYENVQKRARIQLTCRGILNATQYRYFVHLNTFTEMMVQEGFDRSEVDEILAKEKSNGRLDQFKIIYPSRQGFKHKIFPIIPLYHYQDCVAMNSGNIIQFRARIEDAGEAGVEEDYLLGAYTKEMANQAREYISAQKAHIKERVKNGASEMWSYYQF